MVVISVDDKRYPSLLKEVVGRPPFLYTKGDLSVLRLPMVAVVGSRKATSEGLRKTRLVVKELVEMGKVIVSGLAYGVDRMAHESALEYGGKTIAVLGHGLDMVYPREHEKLATEIVLKGGLLVSELEEGVTPKPWYFLERNRIMVGMSKALIVIEADTKSGSMASANHAAEMGREVMAVPGSKGTDLLIEEGAISLGYIGR